MCVQNECGEKWFFSKWDLWLCVVNLFLKVHLKMPWKYNNGQKKKNSLVPLFFLFETFFIMLGRSILAKFLSHYNNSHHFGTPKLYSTLLEAIVSFYISFVIFQNLHPLVVSSAKLKTVMYIIYHHTYLYSPWLFHDNRQSKYERVRRRMLGY